LTLYKNFKVDSQTLFLKTTYTTFLSSKTKIELNSLFYHRELSALKLTSIWLHKDRNWKYHLWLRLNLEIIMFKHKLENEELVIYEHSKRRNRRVRNKKFSFTKCFFDLITRHLIKTISWRNYLISSYSHFWLFSIFKTHFAIYTQVEKARS